MAFALCTALSTPAMAMPAFQPTGAWQVGAAQLPNTRGLEGMSLPCVVSNEYDNGFTVRFSGGGQQILAMAIDFRQDIFRPGRKYSALLSLGDTYAKQVTGSAFTANTLIFNLRGLEDFYKVAAKAPEMELNIAENVMTFTLNGLGASYSSLEQCYSGMEAMPEPVPQAPVAAKMDEIVAQTLPQSMNDIMRAGDAASAAPTPITPAANVRISEWNATAGEDIQTVLYRWADRAGYDLKWDAQQGGAVAQDVAFNGNFEDAVSQLLAENSAAGSLKSRIDNGSSKQSISRANNNSGNWTAAQGASMENVLNQWAAKAGVTLVWKASINAPVKQAVTMSGPFEAAVQVLLDQYMNDSARPLGSLNVDPATGVRTLTISMDRAG